MADDDKGNDNLKTLIDVATEGLRSKNKDLLSKLKDAQKITAKFEGIDVDELLKSQKTLKKLQDADDKKSGDYKKLYEKQTADHATALGKLTDERDKAVTSLQKLQKSTSIRKELGANFVDPVMTDAAELLLADSVGSTDDGAFVVGDKSLADHVKEWTGSELGKRFVLDGNAGGGAEGPGGRADNIADYFNPKSEKYNVTEQAKVSKKNPADYKKYKKQFKTA